MPKSVWIKNARGRKTLSGPGNKPLRSSRPTPAKTASSVLFASPVQWLPYLPQPPATPQIRQSERQFSPCSRGARRKSTGSTPAPVLRWLRPWRAPRACVRRCALPLRPTVGSRSPPAAHSTKDPTEPPTSGNRIVNLMNCSIEVRYRICVHCVMHNQSIISSISFRTLSIERDSTRERPGSGRPGASGH